MESRKSESEWIMLLQAQGVVRYHIHSVGEPALHYSVQTGGYMKEPSLPSILEALTFQKHWIPVQVMGAVINVHPG